MTSLFSRNPASEGAAASLFTDEKTANARAKIIEWLNEAGSGTAKKVTSLSKIQELIVHNDSELLEEFLDNILAFSHDPVQDVRRAVVAFIEEVCKLHVNFVPRVIIIMASLLKDESPQVVKRVIQACAAVYKNTLQWLITLADISDNTEEAWNTLCIMKAEITDMIDHENDGIRTNAIKFLEGVIILQTYPDEDSMKRDNDFSLEDIPMTMKLVRRRKLEDEAIHIFEVLLKFHAASHISSVNLIACTGTLCTIAKMRPTLMSAVVEALKNLHSNLPPTLTNSQVSSVRKHLKMQLINILKQNAAYEMHSTILTMLSDLGATNQEIARAIPKMDKQEQSRRAKRALENATAAAAAAKRQKLEQKEKSAVTGKRQMEIDYEEVEEQKQRCTKMNESFIVENLKTIDQVVELVMASMSYLPNDMPQHFLKNYTPIVNLSLNQTLQKIAQGLSTVMTEKRIGPGVVAITKDPPMRLKVSLEEEKSIIMSMRTEASEPAEAMEEDSMEGDDDENQFKDGEGDIDTRREEATKKLRENMERTKGEQAIIPRMKQRVKTLKLQEVTKPLSKIVKEKFLLESVRRILKAERKSITGGVSGKRRRILTVMAATFTGSVRESIIKFIMEDLKSRLDLAFSWLYEEYSLLQGFTRHSYIKSEQKPDYSYNKLLEELISGVISNPSVEMNKELILHRIYLEAPIISDEAFNQLVSLCETTDLSDCAMGLLREIAISRPPKKDKYLAVLYRYAVFENVIVRDKAIDNLTQIYSVRKMFVDNIDEYALKWLSYLEKPTPPATIFSTEYGRSVTSTVWTEGLAKVCLSFFFALMPHNEQLIHKLCSIYISTISEMKRTILRAIEVPIKKMGSDSAELLQLIEQCPKGSETLITRIIYILTEKQVPSEELVNRVRELYQNKVSDVRLLIPVINGLTKQEIVNALPKLLKLNEVVVKEVFSRLLGIGKHVEQKERQITPLELMLALHTVDTTKCELKFVVKATSLCLSEKECYTQEVMAAVLQQLIDLTPLPTLTMRTVIQSLTLYPRLSGYVTNLLHRLVPKQVWKQKVVWDGFLKCCQRLKPHTFPVLMTLPPQQLQDALNQCPELRQPLTEHANNLMNVQGGSVSKITMDVLLGNSQDLFITEVSGMPEYGTIIPVHNIKVEIEDVPEPILGGHQPLPPGEDL